MCRNPADCVACLCGIAVFPIRSPLGCAAGICRAVGRNTIENAKTVIGRNIGCRTNCDKAESKGYVEALTAYKSGKPRFADFKIIHVVHLRLYFDREYTDLFKEKSLNVNLYPYWMIMRPLLLLSVIFWANRVAFCGKRTKLWRLPP
jgi:hypothetical protein